MDIKNDFEESDVDEALLKEVLVQLYDKLLRGNPNKHDQFVIFISYAWVTERDSPAWKRYDVVKDLIKLAYYLRAAWPGRARGFKVLLDIQSNRPDASLNEYINEISDADAILCILTPPYKAKFDNFDCALFRERMHIEERRKLKVARRDPTRVYPFVWKCDGDSVAQHIEESRPMSWTHDNYTTRSVVKKSFLEKLENILKELLLDRGFDGYDPRDKKRFDKIWSRLNQSSSKVVSPSPKSEKPQILSFMQAAISGDINSLFYHLEQTPQLLNALDENGRSALYHASSNNQPEAVALLLAYEATIDIECTNSENTAWTPLCGAVWGGHREIIRMLISHGANYRHQVKGLHNGNDIFALAQDALANALARRPESIERLRGLTDFLRKEIDQIRCAQQEVSLTHDIEFVCPENGHIEVIAELSGKIGHWHIKGCVNGNEKAYIMLLHPDHVRVGIDVGADVSGCFSLEVKKGDKVIITSSANEKDIFEEQLNFSAIFHPIANDHSPLPPSQVNRSPQAAAPFFRELARDGNTLGSVVTSPEFK